jgi:hypothetical protein
MALDADSGARDDSVALCAYCETLPAEQRDHVVPRALRRKLADTLTTSEYADLLTRFPDTVPACGDCNTTKSDIVCDTWGDLCRVIAEHLRARHHRLLGSPDWTTAELDELGFTLRTTVEGHQAAKALLRERLSRLEAEDR